MESILKYSLLLQFFNIIQYGHTRMPSYCLEPFNTSDCNVLPRQVFSYYKPGSRCELEVWRGCPTANMFESELECSDTCIFRNVETEIKVSTQKVKDVCLLSHDANDCDEKIYHVFKYNPVLKDCEKLSTSCKSPGVFEEKLECIETCVRQLSWEEKMELVSTKQVKELDTILENLFNTTVDSNESDGDDQSTTLDIAKSTLAPTEDGGDGTPATEKKLNVDDVTTKSDENVTTIAPQTVDGSVTGGTTVDGNVNNTQATTETVEITTMKRGTVPFVDIA